MKIIFAGTPDFAVPALHMLINSNHLVCAVYTQPDRPSGRGRKRMPSPIKKLALAHGIAVFQAETLKTERDLKLMASLNADLMVVAAYGIIIPQKILDTPKLGCINIHASLLPRWRGAAPIHRALMAGDEKTGITIMKVVKKLDAGDMLYKEECMIEADDTSSDLHDKLADLGAIALQKVLSQIETNSLIVEKQQEELVTYASKLEKTEAVVDWQLSAIELARKIRGLNNWPVAQTLYKGKVLRIWKATLADNKHSVLSVGCLKQQDKRLFITTGEGVLEILEVQLPNGKRMGIPAFLNAHDVDGIRLGH